MRGTAIKAADGDRKIEELAIGDLLPTTFGGLRPIQWIAHYPLKKSRITPRKLGGHWLVDAASVARRVR
jgi:Hint domain-containing protein